MTGWCPHCHMEGTERTNGCCSLGPRRDFEEDPEAWLQWYMDRPKWVHVVGPGGFYDVLEGYDFSTCPRLASTFAAGLIAQGKTVHIVHTTHRGVEYLPALRTKTA